LKALSISPQNVIVSRKVVEKIRILSESYFSNNKPKERTLIMLRYIIPALQESAQVSRLCPYCQQHSGVTHQHRTLAVTDTRLGQVHKIRMRCSSCRRSWTCQPAGLQAHFPRSQRVRALNLLFYALGLSYEACAQVMSALGAVESDTSVYRDVVSAMTTVKQLHHRGKRRVRLAGIDATYQRLAQPFKAHHESLVMVVDFADGALLEVELLDEQDEAAVAALIKDLQAQYGIEDWVSDEHLTYETVIEKAHHYLCTTHFKKNKLRRCRELQQQTKSQRLQQAIQELEDLLRQAPADGQARAGEIYRRQKRVKRVAKGKRASPAARFKQLAREVYEKWERVWQHTNNATERMIGWSLKVRSKLMRGFKVKEHMVGFARLSGWMRGQGERVELGKLLA
jgi:hypothetical protein